MSKTETTVIDDTGDEIVYTIEVENHPFCLCPSEPVARITGRSCGNSMDVSPYEDEDACIVPIRALREFPAKLEKTLEKTNG